MLSFLDKGAFFYSKIARGLLGGGKADIGVRLAVPPVDIEAAKAAVADEHATAVRGQTADASINF